MTPVRLEPATLRSRVKHSTTEPLRSRYIKSHLELQREITLIELAPSPYFFVSSICLAYMNMFARFDENPAMTLRVIKEKALY